MNGARYAYLEEVCALASANRDIVVVSADYAAPVFDSFRKEHPEQYISVGIAEQNLMAVSSGLAMAGKRPVAYGLAPFPILRAYDQIKCAVANMRLPVNIAASGVGFSESGITHANIDDIAMARSIPNMKIITPTDNIMGRAAAGYALESAGPVYLRFDKCCEGEVYAGQGIDFGRGFGILRDGSDAAVVTGGYMALCLCGAADSWEAAGVSVKIIDLHSLPFDASGLFATIGDLPIVTAEEHILHGGIGSAILEYANASGRKNTIRRMGIDFGGAYPASAGSREYYIQKFGLCPENVFETIMSIL
jgi:transketolase